MVAVLAWVPVIGDPLTLVAGITRAPLGWFLGGVGTVGRCVVVAWVVVGTWKVRAAAP